MNAFENLLVDNKFLQLANFQHSTTFNVWKLSRFNSEDSTTFNFQLSTLITFNIQQLQYLTTLIFNNFQDSTLKIQQLSTFNFDNLVSNMQFSSVLELATYRNLEVKIFRLLTLKTSTFVVWGFNFEILTLKFEDSSFEDFHFRTLKFQVSNFRSLKFQISHFQSYLRFLSLP